MSLDETQRDADKKRRDPRRKLPQIDTKATWHTGYWIAALLAVLLFQSFWTASQKVDVIPYSEFQDRPQGRQGRGGPRQRQLHPGHAEGARRAGPATNSSRPASIRDLAADLEKYNVKFAGTDREHLPARSPLLGAAGRAVLRRLDVRLPAHRREARAGRRLHVDRQEQGQGLCRDRHQGDVRRRRRRRRGQGRAARRSSTS